VAEQSAAGEDVAISRYGISMTTLEEVFMKIGQHVCFTQSLRCQ